MIDMPAIVQMTEVDGKEYPVCHVEDCSDMPNQIGVWTNKKGMSFLIIGENTYPITP